MFSLLVLGVLFAVGVLVVGLLTAVLSLVGFVIALPFRILGLALRLVGFVLALPFLLLAGVLGFGFALFPLLPFVAVAALVWWLVRGRRDHRSQATVVS